MTHSIYLRSAVQQLGFWAILLLGITACNDTEILSPAEQLEVDLNLIEDYLATNNINAEVTESGLHYVIEEEGNGMFPTLEDEVSVSYRGYLLNGDTFDETEENMPVSFVLGNLIFGWQEGLQLFPAGSKGKLFIPSGLGYGSLARPGIPANSVLLFDIELVDVINDSIRFAREIETIQTYLADNNLVADSTASGLHYVIEETGDGSFPTLQSNIKVAYAGSLLDGSVFDTATEDNPLIISLDRTIFGWQEGIQKFQRGGKGKLLIPSSLGYGNARVGDIPPNSILLFDVHLIDF